jgi:hypothetical protein
MFNIKNVLFISTILLLTVGCGSHDHSRHEHSTHTRETYESDVSVTEKPAISDDLKPAYEVFQQFIIRAETYCHDPSPENKDLVLEAAAVYLNVRSEYKGEEYLPEEAQFSDVEEHCAKSKIVLKEPGTTIDGASDGIG